MNFKKFLDELKRRNVYKVAVVYLVTAWLLLQVASIFLPTFEAPSWVLKTVTLILMLGFPLALIFAWAFEITPEGLRKTREVAVEKSITPSTGKRLNRIIIGILSLAVIALLIDSIVLRNGFKPPIMRAQFGDARAVFAVMPFDVQGSSDIEYLREGMVDLLSAKLDNSGTLHSLDPNLVLTSVETVDRFIRDPQYAISKLKGYGANRYVLGSINELGDQLVFNASLYDEKGASINRVEVTKEKSLLVEGIDEMVFQLISKEFEKQGKEIESFAATSTKNILALRAFLLGTQEARRGAFQEAYNSLQTATELDSSFALAWLKQYEVLGWVSGNRNVAFSNIEKYKDRLPRKYQEIHLMNRYFSERRVRPALQLIDEMIRRYGEDVEFLRMKGEILFHQFYAFDEQPVSAKPYFEKALALEPENTELRQHLIQIAHYEGQKDIVNQLFSQVPEEATQWTYWKVLQLMSNSDSISDSELIQIIERPDFELFSLLLNSSNYKNIDRVLALIDRMISLKPELAQTFGGMMTMIFRGQEQKFFNDVTRQFGVELAGWLFEAIGPIYSPFADFLPEIYDAFTGRLRETDHAVFHHLLHCNLGRAMGRRDIVNRHLDSIDAYLIDDDPEVRMIAEYAWKTQKAYDAYENKDYDQTLSFLNDVQAEYAPRALTSNVTMRPYPQSELEAQIYFEQGQFEKALEVYRRFQHINNPPDLSWHLPYVTYRRAICHEQLGQVDQALPLLNTFIDLYKNCDDRFKPWLEEALAARERIFKN